MRKSNSQANSRSGKLAVGRGQSSVPKAKVRMVRAVRKSLNKVHTARKARKPETRRAMKTAKAVPVVKRKAVSPQERELERGRRLKELHQKGHSLAELGRTIGRSKSLARDLVALASLPKDLEEAYLQGRIGRKTAVKMARARRSAAKKNPPPQTQQPQPKENPVPVMSEEERDKRITEGADLIVEWFRTTELAPCDGEMFWSQVNSALYGGLPWLFTSEAPKPGEINPEEDPWAVIKRCRAKSEGKASMADVINDRVKELARWSPRVFPDRKTRDAAIDLARRHLLRGEQ